MTAFSVIGLIGHLHNERATYSLKRLISFLQKRGVDFVLEQETAGLLIDDPMFQAAHKIVSVDNPQALAGERSVGLTNTRLSLREGGQGAAVDVALAGAGELRTLWPE